MVTYRWDPLVAALAEPVEPSAQLYNFKVVGLGGAVEPQGKKG